MMPTTNASPEEALAVAIATYTKVTEDPASTMAEFTAASEELAAAAEAMHRKLQGLKYHMHARQRSFLATLVIGSLLAATPSFAQSPTQFRIGDVVPGMTDERLDAGLRANSLAALAGRAPDPYIAAVGQLRLQGQLKAYEARLRAGQQAAPAPAYNGGR